MSSSYEFIPHRKALNNNFYQYELLITLVTAVINSFINVYQLNVF
jgi:hypothetical protein